MTQSSIVDEHTIRRLSAEVLGCKAFGEGKKRIPARNSVSMAGACRSCKSEMALSGTTSKYYLPGSAG
jgi:hypothetical protein